MEIEIFYTSVESEESARSLQEIVHRKFPAYSVNFDLADCDRIMRVVCYRESIACAALISLLNEEGIIAGLLPDIIPSPRLVNCFTC